MKITTKSCSFFYYKNYLLCFVFGHFDFAQRPKNIVHSVVELAETKKKLQLFSTTS
jgi:hypothetical protein